MKHYWPIWAMTAFTTFFIPEMWALVTKHPENTLSEYVWRLEGIRPGQTFWQWTFLHLLFTAIFGFISFWLFLHFGWRKFR